MDKAKAAVGDFLHKSGNKDTTVHETVSPAVTKETVAPARHEEKTPVIDKEVHQHHYHTSVQPVTDREVLPEQHTHQMVGAEERSFQHGNPEDDKARVATEAAQFRDERTIAPTAHTSSTAPTVSGEHVHHHVHETIQPVVHKETVQPQVVHTTVPIKETHENPALHHGTHELPPVSKTELESKGVSLSGREERYDHFQGEPKPIDGHPGATASTSTTGTHGTSSTIPSSGTTGTTGTTSSTIPGTSSTTGTTDTSSTGNPPGYSTDKPSLMDKINPKVDSTGDGKAGFMK